MKGFITVMCILLVILVALFFYQSMLYSISDDMLAHINKIEKYVKNDDWKSVDIEMKRLTKMWDEVSRDYAMTIDHEELDLIMISMFRADEYRYYRNETDFMVEIVNLEKLVDHIPNKEKLSLENIL